MFELHEYLLRMNMNIGFIGVGKLGMPCAEEIVKKGHSVKGYDVAPVESDFVEIVSSVEDCVKDRDIVFIAVPTPHHADYDGRDPSTHLAPRDFDYSIVKDTISPGSFMISLE